MMADIYTMTGCECDVYNREAVQQKRSCLCEEPRYGTSELDIACGLGDNEGYLSA